MHAYDHACVHAYTYTSTTYTYTGDLCTKGTRAHTHRELIREWLREPTVRTHIHPYIRIHMHTCTCPSTALRGDTSTAQLAASSSILCTGGSGVNGPPDVNGPPGVNGASGAGGSGVNSGKPRGTGGPLGVNGGAAGMNSAPPGVNGPPGRGVVHSGPPGVNAPPGGGVGTAGWRSALRLLRALVRSESGVGGTPLNHVNRRAPSFSLRWHPSLRALASTPPGPGPTPPRVAPFTPSGIKEVDPPLPSGIASSSHTCIADVDPPLPPGIASSIPCRIAEAGPPLGIDLGDTSCESRSLKFERGVRGLWHRRHVRLTPWALYPFIVGALSAAAAIRKLLHTILTSG